MNINFKCETNKDYVAINTLKVTLKDGGVLYIDRDTTEYDIEGTTLNMTWNNCYLWTLNGQNIFGEEGYHITEDTSIKEFKTLLKGANYEFFLDEDMDEDYIVLLRDLGIE